MLSAECWVLVLVLVLVWSGLVAVECSAVADLLAVRSSSSKWVLQRGLQGAQHIGKVWAAGRLKERPATGQALASFAGRHK